MAEPEADSDFDARTRILSGAIPGGPPVSGGPIAPMEMVHDEFGGGNMDDEGDGATRVMAVPRDLLAAAAGGLDDKSSARSTASRPAPPVPGASDDEQHLQDVFSEFVATREKCGEAADGLTFDKFAVKLRKNREQLTQKLNCRSVRFQVYVKEGKAAIKASPVRD